MGKRGDIAEAMRQPSLSFKGRSDPLADEGLQICEGKFAVRGTKWGHHFELWEDDIDLICRSIERQKYHAVCLNDSKTDVEFEKLSSRLKASFESILPEPSAFEKYSERSER